MSGVSTIRLSASETLPLGGRDDRVLRVDQGVVELFLVWDSPLMQGRRHHFASLPAGSWIFDLGFGFRDHGVSVLAIGQAETEVAVLDPAREPAATVTEKLDDWIARVESGLTEILPAPPPGAHQILPGDTPPLAAGGVAAAEKTPLWWAANLPGALFYGVKEVDVEFTPLTPDAWVICPRGAPASRALTSRELLDRPDGLEEVARAHDLFLRTIQAGVLARGESELRARERRSRLREAAGDTAWGHIASVLDAEQGATHGDSLTAAFTCVAGHSGITPRIPTGAATLAAMVRKSSIRARQVMLEGEWFRRDNGPLIGFLEDGEAVALLPRRGRTILQKADGSRAVVTADTPLRPVAHMLYRSLPDRQLTLRDLAAFCLRGNGPDLRTLSLMILLTGLFGLAIPLFTAGIFNLVIPLAERQVMVQIGAALLGAAVVKAVLELVRGVALLRLQNRTALHLQAAVWDRLLKMPARFFRNFTAGDLAARAQGITEMQDVVSSAGMAVLFALPVGLFNLLVMFHQSPVLALWGLGLALLALAVALACQAREVLLLRHQVALQGKLAGLGFQLIKGLAKIRIAGAEHLAFATWARDYARQQRHGVEAGRWGIVSRTFFAGYWLFTALVIFAVRASQGEGLATGSFLAFCAAFGALVASLLVAAEQSLPLLRLIPLFERTKPIFADEPEVTAERAEPGPLAGEIEMANVTFRYAPDLPPVLRGFSLRIKPGEFVALVGPSGSGKSTALRLLLGFESPEAGTVFYDGKNLRALDLREVRRQCGVVGQSTSLIAGDLFRNIVGDADLALDDAWHAAEMAGLADDIRALPMGMHTVVGEGGGAFSGGQRQRLAIARALARRPRLLFLDEATSSLDNPTQAAVMVALEKFPATRVMIAHRLSTIRHADRIVVIEEGRVVEEGKYADLMAQKGFFHALASRQLMGAEGA